MITVSLGCLGPPGRNLLAPFQFCIAANSPKHTPIYQMKNYYRAILATLFLSDWAKLHFTINLRILLKVPAVWCVIVAANSVEGRQYLLKLVWRLGLGEQLGTSVTGRLLTQKDGEEKKPHWDGERREKRLS